MSLKAFVQKIKAKLQGTEVGKVWGILMPALTGKTTLAQLLNNYTSGTGKVPHTLFVDVDEFTKGVLTPEESALLQNAKDRNLVLTGLFPKIKKAILDMFSHYKDSNLSIITSNVTLLHFLQVKAKRILSFIPSAQSFVTLTKQIASKIGDSKVIDQLIQTVLANKLTISHLFSSSINGVKVFDVLGEVVKVIVEIFGLVRMY